MKHSLIPIIIAFVLFFGGCSHDPIYPAIGSLYISSDPTNAEVIVDGQATKQMTPVKIDGLNVGEHTVTLRYYRCKEWSQKIEIKPGQTKMLAVPLVPIVPTIIQDYSLGDPIPVDMAYVPQARKLCVSFLNSNYVGVYFLGDSTILASSYIDVGSPQTVIAANLSADRIYACLNSNTIASMRLTTGEVIKNIVFDHPLGISDIIFSNNGINAYVTSLVDSTIIIIDTMTDSLIRTIKLTSYPNEVIEDITGNYLYVVFKDDKVLSKLDINTGAIVASTATGNEPMCLFWDHDYQNIYLCNASDRTLLSAEAVGLTSLISPTFTYGQEITEGCYSKNGLHIWVIESYVHPVGEETPPPGALGLLYRPTWEFAAHVQLGVIPLRIAQSPDGRFIYILQLKYKDILVIRTDIMN